jgi:hypothetical protein
LSLATLSSEIPELEECIYNTALLLSITATAAVYLATSIALNVQQQKDLPTGLEHHRVM